MIISVQQLIVDWLPDCFGGSYFSLLDIGIGTERGLNWLISEHSSDSVVESLKIIKPN